jgi:malonyl-CoA O-methyltransferase
VIATSPIEAYRLLAPEYDAHPNPLVSLERRVMGPLLPPLKGRRVIDAGSGTGRWAMHCKSQGARVIAVDFSREMLVRGPRPAVLGDIRKLPFRNSTADVTICSFALGYAPGCLRELSRITRPGGILMVSDMHPESARRGWTRSFRHSSGVIEIAHEPYHLEDLHAPGLDLSYLLEPKFGEAERNIFIDAGHGARFEEAAREPAIFVACWIRR